MVRTLVYFITRRFTKARKSPWKLSPTRKANQRKRLKQVDAVIETVRQSGVECSALVRHLLMVKVTCLNGIPCR